MKKQPDVATLEARRPALVAERDAVTARREATERAATAALVAGAPDARKLGEDADSTERELRRITEALRVLDEEIPKARWTAGRTAAAAYLEAAPERCAVLVNAIGETQAAALQAFATATEKLAAVDAERRDLAKEAAGVRVLGALFELPTPVLPAAPPAFTPAAPVVSSARSAQPFSVAPTVGATQEQQRAAVLRALEVYLQKHARSLPAAILEIVTNAGGVPKPRETDRERELREGREHQFDVLAEQTAHLPPVMHRHAL